MQYSERTSQVLKKFKVTATMTTHLEVTIEAETIEEAYEVAVDLDGGQFQTTGAGDWHVDGVYPVADTLTAAQRASIEAVHLNTSCTETEARAYLEANGWDRTRAIVAIYTAMPHARPRAFWGD